jgi:hypothetical protein
MGGAMRPTIDYLNARRALKPASGGTKQTDDSKSAQDRRRYDECCRDAQLDLCERTELECDSAWSDFRIRQEVMWQQIFERFGYLPAETTDEIPF